jgi:hypothetical protein
MPAVRQARATHTWTLDSTNMTGRDDWNALVTANVIDPANTPGSGPFSQWWSTTIRDENARRERNYNTRECQQLRTTATQLGQAAGLSGDELTNFVRDYGREASMDHAYSWEQWQTSTNRNLERIQAMRAEFDRQMQEAGVPAGPERENQWRAAAAHLDLVHHDIGNDEVQEIARRTTQIHQLHEDYLAERMAAGRNAEQAEADWRQFARDQHLLDVQRCDDAALSRLAEEHHRDAARVTADRELRAAAQELLQAEGRMPANATPQQVEQAVTAEVTRIRNLPNAAERAPAAVRTRATEAAQLRTAVEEMMRAQGRMPLFNSYQP